MSAKLGNLFRKDGELVRACLNGDASAWQELVDRYARLVYSIPLRSGLSTQESEQIFQNVFKTVFESLPSLSDQPLLAAWLIAVTQNECKAAIRAKSPNPDTDENSKTLSPDQAKVWERQYLVRQAIDQLPPECRQLFTALFLDSRNLSYKEIAQTLNIPAGNVGINSARCFKKLEAILETMHIDLDD